ncbi:NnrU family protein [Novosphingobium sp. CECT 9465]|uniref:NnrU family protein n=1 Tax=Novosphingobium sp. CECT 9465 TaxID=2829794 RepID=UPI001E3FF2E4|nr:NnrU family protein [Novosphingobium sp. CECT 9465]CAH0498554.1 hypothetical protein NVSP9465_03645 [Novosphingobium sp. CECT 9465]
MDNTHIHLTIAMASFVLSHFLMSGPLRRTLVSAMREQGFALFYSMVSLCTLTWGIVAFDRALSTTPVWDGTHPLPWLLGSVLTIVSLALLLPSFVRNPALPGVKAAGLGTVIPTGVFKITRHPMMWAFSLWAIGHIIVAPELRMFIFMGSIILIALLGSHFQDKRKVAQNNREFGPWQRRTTFWPDVRQFGRIGIVWLIAVVLWFLATTLHWELFGIPAGLWLLFR